MAIVLAPIARRASPRYRAARMTASASALVRRVAPPAFWLALAFAVVMALLPKPPEFAADKFGDKFHHILAFATLTALAIPAFPQASQLRIAERLSFLGALIEVFQSIPAIHRDCDVKDWIADTLAILAVLALAQLVRIRRRPQAS